MHEDAHRAELGPPAAPELVRRDVQELVEMGEERLPQEQGSLVVRLVGAALRLGDDPVDDTELEAVRGVRFERRCGLLRLGGVAPKNRGAALRRDHGVDGVLLHEHAVGDGDRDGAAGAPLADDDSDRRDLEPQHARLRPGDRSPLAVLLRRDAGVCARRVDERDERKPVSLCELHRPHRLPIPLRVGHAEVPEAALRDVPSLLVPDECDRATPERAEARDDRVVVHAAAIAVQLEPVVEDALDVVERVGALLVSRQLDRAPDLLVRRVLAQALELSLQALQLRRELRSAEELDAGKLGEAVAEPELGLLAHPLPPNRRSRRASVGRSSARGTTASTCPKRKFDSARPKSSGSFSRVVCATTRGPANEVSAPGSARITSPRLAKLAVTPPVVGCARTERRTPPDSCSSSTAATVFGSCISARMPSCILAPPEADTETTTPRSSAARSQARANRSPT